MEQEIQLTLAEFCKDRRREVGLTLKDLADQMGYKHPNFISMIESGQSRVPIEKFEVLSLALHVAPAEMLRRIFEEYHPQLGAHFSDEALSEEDSRILKAFWAWKTKHSGSQKEEQLADKVKELEAALQAD
jgi:transcriptional regulator with XRE-family HTH domain